MQILLLIVVLSCKFWVHHTWLIPNIQHSASVMPHRTLRITQGVQMSCDRRAHQAQKAAVSYIIHPPILHVSPSSELSIVCCCTCGVPIGHALRDQLRQLDDMRSSSASGECICVVLCVNSVCPDHRARCWVGTRKTWRELASPASTPPPCDLSQMFNFSRNSGNTEY